MSIGSGYLDKSCSDEGWIGGGLKEKDERGDSMSTNNSFGVSVCKRATHTHTQTFPLFSLLLSRSTAEMQVLPYTLLLNILECKVVLICDESNSRVLLFILHYQSAFCLLSPVWLLNCNNCWTPQLVPIPPQQCSCHFSSTSPLFFLILFFCLSFFLSLVAPYFLLFDACALKLTF